MEQLEKQMMANGLSKLRETITFRQRNSSVDNEDDFTEHALFVKAIGDMLLEREGREFMIDDNNKSLLRFLLYYFNGSNKCEDITFIPGVKTSVSKNLILFGQPGTGKSLLMKIFSHYTNEMKLPLAYRCTGVTELMNYYKQYGHINPYTYNSAGEINPAPQPQLYCLNDIGLDVLNQKNYGTNMELIIDEWLYSRYEIWLNSGYRFFITTNQTFEELMQYDKRIVDRFKSCNIIPVTGESRR